MAGGQKVMNWNSLERALSTDFNRTQTFSGFQVAELLRWMVDATAQEEQAAGPVSTFTGLEPLLRGTVVNGLYPFVPAGAGGTLIQVAAGLVLLDDLDSPLNTDVSVLKFV